MKALPEVFAVRLVADRWWVVTSDACSSIHTFSLLEAILPSLLLLLRRLDVVRMVDSRPSREPMQSHLHRPSVPGLLNERSNFLQLG
jgi:hypothetical protein